MQLTVKTDRKEHLLVMTLEDDIEPLNEPSDDDDNIRRTRITCGLTPRRARRFIGELQRALAKLEADRAKIGA